LAIFAQPSISTSLVPTPTLVPISEGEMHHRIVLQAAQNPYGRALGKTLCLCVGQRGQAFARTIVETTAGRVGEGLVLYVYSLRKVVRLLLQGLL